MAGDDGGQDPARLAPHRFRRRSPAPRVGHHDLVRLGPGAPPHGQVRSPGVGERPGHVPGETGNQSAPLLGPGGPGTDPGRPSGLRAGKPGPGRDPRHVLFARLEQTGHADRELHRWPGEVQVRAVEDPEFDQPDGIGLRHSGTLVVAVSELQDVLRAIEEGAAAGGRMALATIVGVSGSTYRREGARLLVPENGKPVGTISGGCLEGDVREAAAEVMKDRTPRLLHFDLTADDEVVWGWGLGCNGVVEVFVEPAEGAVQTAGAIRRAIEGQRRIAVVTVIEAVADAPALPGARLLVGPDGQTEGSIGDGSLDGRAAEEALGSFQEERSGTVTLAPDVRAFV